MDQTVSDRLRNPTQAARTLLEQEFASQLEGTYDILLDGSIAGKPGAHLDAAGRLTRRKLVEALKHRMAGGREAADTVSGYIREAAFTCLNRFVALKMLEARGLVQVCVSRGEQSNGFREFCGLAPGLSELKDGGYQLYLECLFDELSTEIKVLFDRRDPASLLWPRRQTLLELFGILNQPELASVWTEDETIGWVYQYFNTEEERRAMRVQKRGGSQAPRNSHELAVRNQFFTPRYVVEFLTDNTLGRIWYEMQQGRTALVEKCQYLIRRPDEVFLGRMTSPDEESSGEGCIEMARLLQGAADSAFIAFDTGDEHGFQRRINLGHCVDGYERHDAGDEATWRWMQSMRCEVQEASELSRLTTQDLLDFLFLTCRSDQATSGNGCDRDWYVRVANEVRSRALRSSEPDLPQEELLIQPAFISYRPRKDPRDLKILDPACGSGHFLLYCFNLLQTIYEEAWLAEERVSSDGTQGEITDTPDEARGGDHPRLRQVYPTVEHLRAAIPGLILRHNLHGIDIDPRCVQIAAFALWMRAQRAYNDLGLERNRRPPIRKTNIIVAEPMPGERDLLGEFTATLHPKLLGQLVEIVFQGMKHAGEAGSLLRIDDELAEAISAARKQWLDEPQLKQQRLFATGDRRPVQLTFDLSGVTDQDFWREAESHVLTAVRQYANRSRNGSGFRRQLFADDAVHGFAFVDMCRQEYEVVLMNPPFGEAPMSVRTTLYASIPSASQDLFAAFVERWARMLSPRGRLGAITNRLALFKDLLEDWRRDFLLGQTAELRTLADLGYGVLDKAVVEAAAYVVERCDSLREDSTSIGEFFSLVGVQDKECLLRSALAELHQCKCPRVYHQHRIAAFRKIAGSTVPYWASYRWIARFLQLDSAGEKGVIAKKGLETGDDFRFLRLLWEIPLHEILPFSRWTPYSKGGEYCPWHDDMHLAFDWREQNSARRRSNHTLYGKCGITYTERTTSNFAGRVLPENSLFSPAGPGVFGDSESELWGLLGFLNSSVVAFYVELMVGGGDTSASGTAARHFSPTLLESLPVPPAFRALLKALNEPARTIHEALTPFSYEETSTRFGGIAADMFRQKRWTSDAFDAFEEAVLTALRAFGRMDQLVCEAYHISPSEIEEMRSYLGRPWPTASGCLTEQEAVIRSVFSDTLDLSSDFCLGSSSNTSRAVKKLCHVADPRYENWAVRLDMSPEAVAEKRRKLNIVPPSFLARHASRIVSLAVGVAFGRWNPEKVFLIGEANVSLESPFQCLPLSQTCLSRSPCDGVLVDDAGHDRDIVYQVRAAMITGWNDYADELLGELCEYLGAAKDDFRPWLRQKFFDKHISEYSKSRRKAPIYWELSVPSHGYSVWLYYHSVSRDTFFRILGKEFLGGKLEHEEQKLARLRAEAGENPGRALAKELERQEAVVAELATFREEIDRIAPLWNPELNDGVIINFAPLWRLVPQHKAWQKECKECWDALVAGDYDWAHLAMHLWPERVVPKCRDDRSLAIAHGLEELLWVEDYRQWRALGEPDDEIEGQKKQRRLKKHDRLRTELAALVQGAGAKLTAADLWKKLEGDELDTGVSLLLWPRRVVEKCLLDPRLADKLRLTIPKRKTDKAIEQLIKRCEDDGCGHLAEAVGAALGGCGSPYPAVWKSLESGDRDDQALTLALWPDRVVDKCVADSVLAQKHDLARFFWYDDPWSKSWRHRESPEAEVLNEVAHRHKPAVKAALESLLSAPTPGNGAKRKRKRKGG